MNCCLQTYIAHQFTYFIYYLFQDNFKYAKIIKTQQVHQDIHAKQLFIILFKLFSIGDSSKIQSDSRNMTDLVTCQCDSCENAKEFVLTSPHVMPHPIIS